jgi:hypothetical protein
MKTGHRTLLVAAAVLSTTSFLRAQSPADPSGHWQGAIRMPNQAIAIEVDLDRNTTGGGTEGLFRRQHQGLSAL